MIHFENFPLFFAWKICLIFSIVSDAISDAKIDNTGHRDHGWELMQKAGILFGLAFLVPYVYLTDMMHFWPMMVRMAMMTGGSYMLLRSGMFNLIYNYMREPSLPYDYLGTTDKWFDKTWFLRKLQKIERERIPVFGKRIPFPALTAFYLFSWFIGVFV